MSQEAETRIQQLTAELESLKQQVKQTNDVQTVLLKSSAGSSSSGQTVKVLALAGSIREASCNLGLLRAAAEKIPDNVEFEVVDVSVLPLVNTDLEKNLPEEVKNFQQKVKDADAFLFAIPEYNYSMSGVFKNALDWASRSPDVFKGKVVGIMGAGGGRGTALAQYHFRQTAVFLQLRVLTSPEVMVNAFETDSAGKFVNCNLETGDLINDSVKDRIGILFETVCDETRQICTSSPPANPKAVKILAVAGSIRDSSVNAGLLRAAKSTIPDNTELELFDIGSLPQVNTDHEKNLPEEVKDFQQKVKDADAFLFAIPEYNYSMSGVFKNALDWASRSPDVFKGKVVGIMGAGGGRGTALAQYHFRQTAVFLQLRVLTRPEVMVNAFETDSAGKFVNCNLETGDLINDSVKDRVHDLVTAIRDESLMLTSPQLSAP